jgi:hypothetical protein
LIIALSLTAPGHGFVPELSSIIIGPEQGERLDPEQTAREIGRRHPSGHGLTDAKRGLHGTFLKAAAESGPGIRKRQSSHAAND